MTIYTPEFSAAVRTMLERARLMVGRDGAWTQGHLALDRKGEWMDVDRRGAVQWSAIGAIWQAVADGVSTEEYNSAHPFKPSGWHPHDVIGNACIDAVREAVGADNLTHWNNAPERTQEEVVAAFDAAIAALESAPAALAA